jgi:hypothetical protein
MIRLTKEYQKSNSKSLTDFLIILMWNIEDAFLAHDGVPGKDYTLKDLMDYAIKLSEIN